MARWHEARHGERGMNQLTQIQEGRRIAGLRLASAAWRAFGAAIELLLIAAVSIGCGVAWHLAFHDMSGDLVALRR